MSSETHPEFESVGHHSHEVGYEKRDASLKSILLIGLAIIITIVVTIIFLSDLFISSKEEIIYQQVLKPESIPLRELRAQEAEILNSYAVIDTANRIYRIPINRAMEILSEEAFSTQIRQKEEAKN